VSGAQAAVERLTGARPTGARPLGGALTLVAVTGGRTVVAKHGAGVGAVDAEAAGLRWLGEHGDVPVPAVLGHDADWLVMEHVRGGRPGAEAAERFGHGLAALHLRGAPAFGSPPPGGPTEAWMGLAPMRNEPCPEWPSFYAQHRIRPYVRSCVEKGLFSAADVRVFDEVRDRLPELAGEPEPPARLHGDAWSGNVLWAQDGAWLIDPAAHGGHRETDLAMLGLFGIPELDRILGAYAEAAAELGSPLADGWRDRTPLHRLFPLLMHAAVFGGGYAGQALASARSSLR
jgi:fructosamine-3-kinase